MDGGVDDVSDIELVVDTAVGYLEGTNNGFDLIDWCMGDRVLRLFAKTIIAMPTDGGAPPMERWGRFIKETKRIYGPSWKQVMYESLKKALSDSRFERRNLYCTQKGCKEITLSTSCDQCIVRPMGVR